VSERGFAVVATAIGILFMAITPPFQVPDEWAHYLRSEAIAQGHIRPRMTWQGDCESFPIGVERFIRATYRTSGKFTIDELRVAARIPREATRRSTLCFSAWYTPLPYAPQVIVAAASHAFDVRPFITFYAGRFVNLVLAIMLIVVAMRIAPGHRNVIAAAALLPMAMYQLGSWSADGPTFAVAVVLTALLLRAAQRPETMTAREAVTIAGVAMAVAMCKPVYFLIALLVLGIPRRRYRSVRQRIAVTAGVMLAVAVGVGASVATVRQAHFNARIGQPIDAREQARCVAASPVRFAAVAVRDLRANGNAYLEEIVGRLGMTDLQVPKPVVWLELILLVAVGVTSIRPASLMERLLSVVIILCTILGVLLSQYLVWSVICGDAIEGVQGRYFLPILPLAVASMAAGIRVRERLQIAAVAGTAIVANGAAVLVLMQRYWG
jgi:uncharacterized membrane protein